MSRVYLIDDHEAVRSAVSRQLRACGYQVSSFASADDFLQQPELSDEGCAIIDLQMPGMDGLTLQRLLQEKLPRLAVIFLSGQGDLPSGVAAMKQGAVDFLPKPVEESLLLAALQQALAQNRERRAQASEQAAIAARYASLTPREREVLHLVVDGLLNKQVGDRLGMAEKTVKAHRAKVMEKMQAGSLAELVKMSVAFPTRD